MGVCRSPLGLSSVKMACTWGSQNGDDTWRDVWQWLCSWHLQLAKHKWELGFCRLPQHVIVKTYWWIIDLYRLLSLFLDKSLRDYFVGLVTEPTFGFVDFLYCILVFYFIFYFCFCPYNDHLFPSTFFGFILFVFCLVFVLSSLIFRLPPLI